MTGMFKNPEFQQHSTVDKRGRKVEKRKNQENMRKYYKLRDQVRSKRFVPDVHHQLGDSCCLCLYIAWLLLPTPWQVSKAYTTMPILQTALPTALGPLPFSTTPISCNVRVLLAHLSHHSLGCALS